MFIDGFLRFFCLYIDDSHIYICILCLFPERLHIPNCQFYIVARMFNGHLKLNISPKLLSPPIPSICTFSWNVKPILGVQVQPPSNLQLLFFSYFLIPVQFSSVAQSCPTLCDPMNRSTPGLPVYHQLPEFTQTHVHQVTDAIQPSHPLSSPSPPLSSPSPPALNPSQHQSLFQRVNSSHQVAKVLEFQL